MIFDENKKVDCCTLIADCIRFKKDYLETGNTYTFSYHYYVPISKIEESKKFIEETFKLFGQPCSRVYISGFSIQSESSIWTKERIVNQIKMDTEKNNVLLEENRIMKAR